MSAITSLPWLEIIVSLVLSIPVSIASSKIHDWIQKRKVNKSPTITNKRDDLKVAIPEKRKSEFHTHMASVALSVSAVAFFIFSCIVTAFHEVEDLTSYTKFGTLFAPSDMNGIFLLGLLATSLAVQSYQAMQSLKGRLLFGLTALFYCIVAVVLWPHTVGVVPFSHIVAIYGIAGFLWVMITPSWGL